MLCYQPSRPTLTDLLPLARLCLLKTQPLSQSQAGTKCLNAYTYGGNFGFRTQYMCGKGLNLTESKRKKCICMLYTNIKHTCTYVYTSILDLAWGRDQRTRDRLRGWRGQQVGAITVRRADTAKGRYVVSSPERQAQAYRPLSMLSFLRRDSMPQGSENLLWWTYRVI